MPSQDAAHDELSRLNRVLRLLSSCNQALIRAGSEQALLQQVCLLIVEQAGYKLAWVGLAENDESQSIRPVAQAGFEEGYLESLHLTWADRPRGRGPSGCAVRCGEINVVSDIAIDPSFAPWREEALARGYQSCLALPLTIEGHTMGALTIYAAERQAFDRAELEVLKGLADDLAFGLSTLRMREAHSQAINDLTLFRQLINRVSDMILVVEPAEGRILDANDTACRALGYSRSELLSLTISDINPHLSAAAWADYAKDLQAVGSRTMEGLRRRKDGTLFPVEISVSHTILNRKDYVISVVRDISDRLRAQHKLQLNEGLLREAQRLARLGNFLHDLVNNRVTFSDQMLELLGLSPDEDLNFGFERFLAFIHPHDRESMKERVLANIESDMTSGMVDFRWVLPDGQVRYFSALGNITRDETGRPLSVFGIMQDVTEHRLAEAAIEASEAKFRIVAENTYDWEFWLSPEGQFLYCSPSCERVSGYSPADFAADPALLLNIIHPEDRGSFSAHRHQTLAAPPDHEQEFRIVRRDGQERWIAHICAPLHDGQGRFLGVRGTNRDITERKATERALRESESRFRAFFENSPVPIFEEDLSAVQARLESLRQGPEELEAYLTRHPEVVHECAALVRITNVNRAAVLLHEARDKEELLSGLVRTFTAESYEVFVRELVALYRGSTEIMLDGVIRTLSDKRRHVNIFVSKVPGLASRFLVSLIDITELKNSERRLLNAHANLDLLLQTIPDPVWLKDPDGVFLICNPPLERLVGAKPGELVGKTDFDVHPLQRAEEFRRMDLEAAATDQPCAFEQWTVAGSDGRPILLDTIKAAVRNPEGRLVGVLGIARDITAVRKAEENLRQLSRAVEQSPVSIVITNVDGNIEYVNPKFCQVTGYRAEEVLGQNPRLLKSDETPPEEYREMWSALSSGKVWRCEFHNRKKSGELYWELASISPIFDGDGHITHYVAVKEDITERKRLEEEFRQAQKMEAFGQLAGGVAHDFNNILTVIQGNSALLSLGGLSEEEQQEALEQISDGAERAARLTRQLLTFSRRQVVQRKELDLNVVVLNMTRMLQRLIGEHISLEAHYAPGGALVMADEGMMEQVLMNLAVNSRDSMPGGGQLAIHTEVLLLVENPQGHPGNYARLSVTDTGAGIAAVDLPHIFEPFFTTKDIGRGTGLGLATVFGIVQQHQGWVTVDSQVGSGTCVRVHLPLLDKHPRAGEEGRRHVLLERGGNETILLVEDEPSVRRMACRILERHGYKVYYAESGADALRVWGEHRQEIALLLTDMVMPGNLGGWELGKRLKADVPTLKVIYSTGYTDEMLGEASSLRDSLNFLEKPYEPAQILRKVRACLDAT